MTAQIGRCAPNAPNPASFPARSGNDRPGATPGLRWTEAQIPGWCSRCGRAYPTGALITPNRADVFSWRGWCCP